MKYYSCQIASSSGIQHLLLKAVVLLSLMSAQDTLGQLSKEPLQIKHSRWSFHITIDPMEPIHTATDQQVLLYLHGGTSLQETHEWEKLELFLHICIHTTFACFWPLA